MRALPSLPLLALLSLAIAANGCNCGLEPLERPVPHMKVTPKRVVLDGVAVAQDTRIVVQVQNDSIINLDLLSARLAEGSDPAFVVQADFPTEVFAGQTGEIIVVVRPRLVSTIHATLVIDGVCAGLPCRAGDGAQPADHVEVPLVVNAIDAGLPDICDYPESIAFGLVGKNDVARETVPLKNCGVRDLIIDRVLFCHAPADGETPDADGCGANDEIRVSTVLQPGQPLPPQSSLSLELLFLPVDLDEHAGDLVIFSNDPDEYPVVIPVVGRGSACPSAVAELVDDPSEIEPFDTVRIDGSNSMAADSTEPGSFLGRFEWTLRQRPQGSTTTPFPDDLPATEVETDLAGRYIVDLHVYETVFDQNGVLEGEVRSCVPSTVTFDVIPTEDLLIQLVWDHADADLDLHLVRGGGQVFTHEDDCYFSNREPEQTVDEPAWSAVAEENPVLDVDDSRGYGPENLNIKAPAGGSQWTVLVHYWNKQTDGEPRTTATVRVFVYGVQAMEISRTFEDEEQLWQALDITWPNVEGDAPALSQIGIVEPFPRPF
jgi:hypothetical protein